jgi:hypothetical protein
MEYQPSSHEHEAMKDWFYEKIIYQKQLKKAKASSSSFKFFKKLKKLFRQQGALLKIVSGYLII